MRSMTDEGGGPSQRRAPSPVWLRQPPSPASATAFTHLQLRCHLIFDSVLERVATGWGERDG